MITASTTAHFLLTSALFSGVFYFGYFYGKHREKADRNRRSR